jgi:hypothetical protein
MGNDFLGGYNSQKKSTVLDLELTGLPADINTLELKKAIGAKHVIAATVE